MVGDVQIDIFRRMSRRTVGLRVTDEGLVEVRAPLRMPQFLIRRFVQSKADWIDETKKRLLSLPKGAARRYEEGSPFSIAGRTYALHITDGNAVVLAGSRIFFPEKFVRHPKAHMEAFLRTFARKFLSERLAHFSRIMGVSYTKISIRDTSSRWGSCSSSGTISFAYRLVLADVSVIEYVVIHELAHVTHHHHKPSFWSRVEEFCPDYRTSRAWLRKHGHTLRV